MEIRAAEAGDLSSALALHDTLVPYLVVTSTALNARLATPPAPGRATFVAVDRGEVVGWGVANLVAGSDPLDGEVRVLVRPDHQRRGLGTQLLEAVHDSLRAAGATRARVFAEPSTVTWASRWGYQQTRQVHYAGIDPRKAPDPPGLPSDVQLVPLTEVTPEALYAADVIAQRTKPGDARIIAQPYDEWLQGKWNHPETQHDLGVAAVHEDEIIGFTFNVGDRTRIWSRMTATMPEYRGRGLAKLVKTAALRRAADAGVQNAYTANYDGNAPMLAVNEWLGYYRIATHAVLVCPL
ncbi:GNAT family N-acetyltransferase [Kribbella sp. NPDC056951]|uniref:GNAT family N-acetyltransferase n=1 Tax=Kribbella sp. NPDC056951 TaxID=3345978 RepID=UPI00363DF6AF